MSLRDLVGSKDLGDLFITYALLINTYVIANNNSSRHLFQVFKKLGQILNHDRFKACTSNTKADPAFKLLLLAGIQNGLFKKGTLQDILDSKASNSTVGISMDLDTSESSDSSSESEAEMDFEEVRIGLIEYKFVLKKYN